MIVLLIGINANRGLWFRLETPTGVPTSVVQTVIVTIIETSE